MTQFWKELREVDPNDCEAVKDLVSRYFQNVPTNGEADPRKILRIAGDIINRFPKYCMSYRSNIETLLCSSIDSRDYHFVIEAAKCAQALQQVRPSQEKTATPKTSWLNQMNLLCNAGHSLISAVFPDAVDMYGEIRNRNNNESLSNSSLTNLLLNIVDINNQNIDEFSAESLLQIRLRNVFCYIQAMLVEIYPVAKPVRPQTILDLIMRALSVSSAANSPNVDVYFIKIEALHTLDALVASLGPNLIPFSPLVFRLLMQTLRWSSETANQESSKVRMAAYSSLSRWLTTLHCHRSAADTRSCWEDELANHILNDTATVEKVVQLTLGPQPTKHMSKKAKRKLANTRLQESSIASHMPGERNKVYKPEESNNEVAMAALACAETFLLVCGRFLKPVTHKLLQERALRECYNSQNYSEDMLISLLRVLEATRKTLPPGVAPPTQHCLQLYSVLVNIPNGDVSKFCTQALLDIRLHLHCSPPSLNFALEVPQEKQSTSNKRKKVSEKNRAVLESLLGPEKMPALDNIEEDIIQEDIITIPDEPSSKKQRLDEETDNISVSSESINSVEISDDSDIEEIPLDKPSDKMNITDINREKEVNSDVNKTVEIENPNEKTVLDAVDNISNELTPTAEENKTSEPIEEVSSDNPDGAKDFDDVVVETTEHSEAAEEKQTNKIQEKISIYDAPTQLPLNISTETINEEETSSLEVAYDYPNSDQAPVNVLNKVDDETLPCTNETDDGLITCGQLLLSSQDVDLEKKSDDPDISDEHNTSKINGNLAEDDVVENGSDIPADTTKVDRANETKAVSKEGTVSIEDMMADFVDEVNEEVTGN